VIVKKNVADVEKQGKLNKYPIIQFVQYEIF
jgi:hypothetical protein